MRALLGTSLLLFACRTPTPTPAAQPSRAEAPPDTSRNASVAEDASAPTVVATPTPAPAADAAVAAAPTPAEPSRPFYYEAPITPADLAGRSLRELAILRNTPFARRGHTFRRPWLATYFSSQAWYHPARFLQLAELSELDRANVDAIGRYEVSLPRAELERQRDALRARERDHALRPEDAVEAVLLSGRLGQRITLAGAAAVDPEVTPLEEPARLDSLLTVELLHRLSPRDLRIVRNMIYARRGRALRSPILRDYFESMDWYEVRANYSDALLTRVDQQNLRMVQSVEREFGGPMSEAQQRIEDGLGGA